MLNEKRNLFIFMFFFIAATLWLQSIWIQSASYESLSYSEFEELLKSGQVDNLVVTEKTIRGEFKEARKNKTHFVTARVEPELAKDLQLAGVKYSREIENTFWRDLLSWVLPVLLFVGLWVFLSRRLFDRGGVGGLMSVGKSRAKLYVEKDVKTTFEDVAGVDEAKQELREVVDFLKNPADYGRLGARMPKGILLVGPPGTGKTLLAKAVAGEAQVPFFSISGSEFVEMFVGVGAARVRDLFEQAQQKAPCIIFIDELDALGKARAAGPSFGGHDEKEQTLNQLLSELDGFDTKSGVVILAATNRPETLDPALLRAGRFDRQVLVDRPDKIGRASILNVHLKKIKVGQVDVEHLAGLTSGFTGADLANLVNEAALSATRRKTDAVDEEDFVSAIERIVAGLEKKTRILSPHEKEVVAHHEMGHALVACALPGTDRIQKVSIIPRGIGALGYTIQRPTEDRYLMTQQELLHKMAVLLGGRMSEQLIFSEISTGAADDLVRVTDLAQALVTRYGMSPALGNVVFEQPPSSFLERPFSIERRAFSEESAKKIDAEIRRYVDEAAEIALDVLEDNVEILKKGASLLLQKETLSENEIKTLAGALKKNIRNKDVPPQLNA